MTQPSEFEKAAAAECDAIARTQSASEVTRRLGHMLSFDVETATLLAHYWTRPLVVSCESDGAASGSHSIAGELAGVVRTILCAPIAMDGRLQQGAHTHAVLYPFGAEHQQFAVPLALLRSNYVALACALRLFAQGYTSAASDARAAFAERHVSPANSLADFGRFRFNETLAMEWSRMGVVCAIAAYLVATAQRAAATADAADGACDTHTRGARVILLAVLQRVEPALDQRAHPWLDAEELRTFDALRTACRSDATFSASKMQVVLADHYRRLLASRSAGTTQLTPTERAQPERAQPERAQPETRRGTKRAAVSQNA